MYVSKKFFKQFPWEFYQILECGSFLGQAFTKGDLLLQFFLKKIFQVFTWRNLLE